MSNERIVTLPYKSVFAAFILSLLLGPLGTLYASWKASLILLVLFLVVISASISISVAGAWDILFATWIVSTYVSVILVGRYNRKLLDCQLASS